MYSPMNPDQSMPAVPPLYPMYPMDPVDSYMPCPTYPIEPPYMPEPMPIYSPNDPMCPRSPYMPEPTPVYPPTEMPYMCPLMRDPMVRHCVELCLKRCKGSINFTLPNPDDIV